MGRALLFFFLIAAAEAQQIRPVVGFTTPFDAQIQATALDAEGNIYITGTTLGAIPLVNPIKSTLGPTPCAPGLPAPWMIRPCEDAFIAKFDPTGAKLLYSTYLGGDARDFAAGIAVDREGNAFVVVTERDKYDIMQRGPGQAVVYKLNPAGSAIVYSARIEGNARASGIATDSQGNAFVAGTTMSPDFPTVNALQSHAPVKSLFATNDAGVTVRAINNNMRALSVYSVAVDPRQAATLYAGTGLGLFRSLDAVASWTQLLPEAKVVRQVAIDPRSPSTMYVRYGDNADLPSQLVKSVDGGDSWQNLTGSLPPPRYYPERPYWLGALAIDPSNSSVLWLTRQSLYNPAIFQSTDGGAHWTSVNEFQPPSWGDALSAHPDLTGITIDPSNPSRVYVCCAQRTAVGLPGALFRTDDGGRNWALTGAFSPAGAIGIGTPVIDPRNPSTLYSAWSSGLVRSTDAGQTWTAVNLPAGAPFSGYLPGSLAIDSSGTIYLVNDFGRIFRSSDGGATWTTRQGDWGGGARIAGIDPVRPGSVYIGTAASTNPEHAFTAKLSASGAVLWSTLLAGSRADEARGIAVDAQGNAYITGRTMSPDFPTANPLQPVLAGVGDVWISKLSGDGSRLIYSTYLGGNGDDVANAIAVDGSGNAYIAGGTSSHDFPTANALQSQKASRYIASFAAKLDAGGQRLLYSTFLSGTGNDEARTVALDPRGNLWIAGQAGSFDFPLVRPIQPVQGAAYLARLSATGGVLDFSTFVDGNIGSLSLSPGGSVWLAGGSVEPFNQGFLARLDMEPPAAQPGVPAILSIYNAASWRLADIVSPGGIVSLMGTELAPATEAAGTLPLPDILQGVTVTIGGIRAPLYFVSPGQINVQVPPELPLGETVLVVKRNQASVERRIQVVAATPGIFTLNGDGQGQPLIVHASDYSLVRPENPARAGEYLVAFCTGLGATNPTVPAGEPAPPAPVPIRAVFNVGADWGAVPLYAGLAPGFAGLYQVNFQVNERETPGMKTLSITIAPDSYPSFSSNRVPLYVK